ncbi:hypothetical protein IEO21_02595 [Rhodonia placenta]|uniref:Uncharacterized protein n=1 Tax=Rhodonia placenta TaxID=104341 RepID=A0A8H7U4Z6_9APHY|nr:hypothetical protein IEO21_02595 [Postia placenta]
MTVIASVLGVATAFLRLPACCSRPHHCLNTLKHILAAMAPRKKAKKNSKASDAKERCLKHTGKEILWGLLKRYCTPCREKTLAVLSFLNVRDLPRSLTDLRSRDWWKLLNHDDDWGLEEDVDEFDKSWKSLEGKPDAQLEFINTRKSQVAEVQKHAKLCRQWEKDRVASRAKELQQLKRDRFQSALDRLRQLGWGEELERIAPTYWPLAQYDPLRAAQKLTDRIWHNIGGGVVTILEDIRDERRRVRHTEILRKRLDALCTVLSNVYANSPRTVETEYKPRICDMIEMPEVREIIHSSNDPTLGSENEEKLRALFPNLVERWQAEAREELRELASSWVKCVDGVDILALAATHFVCSGCLKLLPYPEILGHECLRASASTYGRHPYNQYCVYAIAAWKVGVNSRPWNGQDGENCVITLRTAVEEEWTRWMSGSYDKTLEYKGHVATEPELAVAKKDGQERLWTRHKYPWCCSLCTPRGDDLARGRKTLLYTIRLHMKETHSIHDAREENGDFYAYPELDMQPF